jgi:hypothetical protein
MTLTMSPRETTSVVRHGAVVAAAGVDGGDG